MCASLHYYLNVVKQFVVGQELRGSAGIPLGSKSLAVQFHVDFGKVSISVSMSLKL